jgi:hypothetical protein
MAKGEAYCSLRRNILFTGPASAISLHPGILYFQLAQ